MPCLDNGWSAAALPGLEQLGQNQSVQLFVERAIALTRRDGRLGLVLPSGLATDHGSAPLRRRLLSHCRVDAIVGMDNHRGVFPIHRSVRFLLLTASAGAATDQIACRLGVDDQDAGQSLRAMIAACASAGVQTFIVHARKAWLEGLSPKENREVPPLDYALVHRLKAAHPNLEIVLNGGLASIEQALAEAKGLDGAMMGRAAYQEPWRLLQVDPEFFGTPAPFNSPNETLLALIPYIDRALANGARLNSITRHVLGVFHGVPGARAFRRHLATEAVKPGAGVAVFQAALALVADDLPRSAAA